MTLWNVNGKKPPPPDQYPVTVYFVNACGYMMRQNIQNEREFYRWRFINWGLQAEGQSLVTREPKRGGEDSGLA